jgi:diguanylate cyclase (GGDEF)-like protein
MATALESNLNAFPDSLYAAELKRGSLLRFSPKLEVEYVRDHLMRSRALICAACVLGASIATFRGIEQLVVAGRNSLAVVDFSIVILASVTLAAIACTSAFERVYLQFARVIVPLRGAVVAVHVAEAAARGQLEMLMVLPIVLIGPFFFLGLRFRTALLSGVLTTACFIASATMFELALSAALRAAAFLIVTLLAAAIAARQLEQRSRTSFLETRLVAEIAERDSLTWTKNRRVFDEHLVRLWPQAIAERRALALLLIDVDHFKAYNDRYGHQAGDQALRRVAQTAQQFVEGCNDVLARYGGEEFAAVLYDCDATQALQTAERIRRAVQESCRRGDTSTTAADVTISIGVAAVKPAYARDPQGALQLADQALYDAKSKGRNRVELMSDAEYQMLVTGIFSLQGLRARSNGSP